jgi:alpha-tubulin suppressor-like RCC1 family protein
MCTAGACVVALATRLAGGATHTCAVLGSGGVACWGNNFNGQIGDGTIVTPRLAPTAAVGVSGAVDVVAGFAHTCALLDTGHVLCWGVNSAGQLGDGTTTTHASAVEVSGLTDAVELASGPTHVCARRTSGAVVCWGSNLAGQLGDGTASNRLVPTPVLGLADAVEIATGAAQTCARKASGSVVCWGENLNGELGDGTTTRRLTPTAVLGLTNAAEIATGVGGRHACARRTTGELVCWGSNSNGEVGDGTTVNRTTPVAVSGLSLATSLSIGGRDTSGHSCATGSTGEVQCWGGNAQGQLGDGTLVNRSTPVTVTGLADIVEIAAGGRHTCARRTSGTVVCWGANTAGQLGDGTIVNRSTPVSVTGWPP